jgi:hypothetical protein
MSAFLNGIRLTGYQSSYFLETICKERIPKETDCDINLHKKKRKGNKASFGSPNCLFLFFNLLTKADTIIKQNYDIFILIHAPQKKCDNDINNIIAISIHAL